MARRLPVGRSSASSIMVSPLTNIGKYRVEREIGRGSFGVVYLTTDEATGEERAVKVLLPWAAKNDQLRHRLRREANLAKHLRSPHIMRIYECEETADGNLYIAMEYLRGRELSEVLRTDGPFSPQRAGRVAEQILLALEDAHAAGIIHRDLKPHNVFLCPGPSGEEIVKVFDFGIAKILGTGNVQETTKLTISGGVMGTPVYMSPEQCRGLALTPASDFYSLGIMLYELLTGNVPFEDENPVKTLLMHGKRAVPPLPVALADTPLGKAVMRVLEKSPQNRFATAAEFRGAITNVVAPSAASAQISAAPSVDVPSPAIQHQTVAKASTTSQPPWLLIAAIGVVAIVVIILGLAITFGFFGG